MNDVLDELKLPFEPVLFEKDLSAQIEDRVALFATEILNKVASEDLVHVDLLGKAFNGVRVG